MKPSAPDISITSGITIKEALKKLDASALKVLLVLDGDRKLIGTLTDGDVRRALLKGTDISAGIEGVYNRNFTSFPVKDYSMEKIKERLLKRRIELIPLTDESGRVADFVTWTSAFGAGETTPRKQAKIDLPVVIMAGGKGTRMAPFTDVLPKALIPIKDRTILEWIIDEFVSCGAREIYLILNYKGEVIRSYMESLDRDYEVHYVKEQEYFGTAGGLKLIEDRMDKAFLVSNCDIIVRADYANVHHFHADARSALTVLSSIQHHIIPYGVVEFENGGTVTKITEKPEHTFTVNTGVYCLDPACFRYFPKDGLFDMTDLISALIVNGRKVTTYPVNEGDFIDIGQWEEYRRAVDRMRLL